MKDYLSSMAQLLVIFSTIFFMGMQSALADEYQAIFWNLESGDSDSSIIASQMVEKGEIDFWGLSEVLNQQAVDTFEAALEAANPGVDFISKISEDGRADRLAILYRSDNLTSVPYSGNAVVDDIGDNFFEVDSINVGGTIRPALGIEIETDDEEQVIILVNHWKCCGKASDRQRRANQATQMNAFAISTPGIPIISGGDFNIPLNKEGQGQEAFQILSQQWTYLKPEQPDNIGTHRGGTVLDGVFISDDLPGWDSLTNILARDGNNIATSSQFSDSTAETDHRPVLLSLEFNENERFVALRESIADMESTLARMKEELSRLED